MQTLFWFSNHTTNTSDISVFEEFYQENLAKALAHYFESKLLILDIYNFVWKVVFNIFFTLLSLVFVLYM